MGFMSACGISRRVASIALLLPLGLLAAQPATADWGKLLKDTAKRAVERETSRQVDRKITETIRCTVGQYDCYEQAQRDGRQVVYVDQDGNVITGADGQPIDDPARAEATSEDFTDLNPDVPRDFDFVAGDRELFATRFESEGVGGFPRELQPISGSMSLVDLNGRRMLRSDEMGVFAVVLAESLPESFTIEFDYHIGWWGTFENGVLIGDFPDQLSSYGRNYFKLSGSPGIDGSDAPRDKVGGFMIDKRIVPVRISVDGSHAKLYIGQQRVAYVSNAQIERSNRVQFHVSGHKQGTQAEYPSYIGNIRIAAAR
jgi:hypothetical protein